MSKKIKLDYGLADEMIKSFNQGHQQLEQTTKEMQKIAQTLEDGALQGQGGAAFTEALRQKLCPAITKLAAKFKEMEKDVAKAVKLMQEADAAAKKALNT